MEGISLGVPNDRNIKSNNIFAILEFKHDSITGYWPYSRADRECYYGIADGIQTLEEEVLLSAKCLIKW